MPAIAETDVRSTSLVALAAARTFLRLATGVVLSSPAPSAAGATLTGDVSGLKVNTLLSVTKQGSPFFVNLQSIAGQVVSWTPSLTGAPSAGDTVSDGTFDANIVEFLDSVSEFLEDYTGRFFQLREGWVETFTGEGQQTFWTRYYPIQNVQVSIAGKVMDPSTYGVDGRGGKIKFNSGYAWGGCSGTVGDCVVTYDAGYDGTTYPVPAHAIGVVLKMLKIQYDGWKTGGMSVNTLSIGGFGLSVVQDLPKQLMRELGLLKDDARQMFMTGGRL